MNQLFNQRPCRIQNAENLIMFCNSQRLETYKIPNNVLSLINAFRFYLANVYDLKYSLNEIRHSIKDEIQRRRDIIMEKFDLNENILNSRISRYFAGDNHPEL